MKAIAIRRDANEPAVIDVSRPEPGPDEALVRVLRVGVDGTDREVIDGDHGGFPDGEDHLILGHEAVGVVEESNGNTFEAGDVVVPTVRRPPDGGNEYFERNEPDMAPEGKYVERGIEGAHGFMAEYVTSPEQYLVGVPREFVEEGFLVEPLSIVEKALEHAIASRSIFDWQPESAIVLGNGSLGLLTLAVLSERDDFERCYCMGRRARPDPTIEFVEDRDATYVDSTETPLSEVPDRYEPMDLVSEATGYERHGVETIEALAPSGVGVLLGLPEPSTFEVDGGTLHRELVMGNRALIGTVNSNVGHFEAAVETLRALPDAVLRELVTGVYDLDEFERAFADDDTTIKTAVQLSEYEER